MNFKTIIFLTAFIVFIFCFGAVSANDNNTDDIVSINDNSMHIIEEMEDDSESISVNNNEFNEIPSEDSPLQDTAQHSSKISVNASTWDDIKMYAEKTDADYIINLEGKKYTIGSGDINFKNNAEIIGTTNCFITGIATGRIPFKSMENRDLNITFKNILFNNINSDMLIQLETNGISIIENCTFKTVIVGQSKNSVVYNSYGVMNMTGCSFIESSAGYGVLSNYNPSTVKNVILNVKDCYFESNYAQVEPGSINNCGILTVVNTTFKNNMAKWWAGAIHTHIGANTTIYNSQFLGNIAGWNGGALYTYSYLAVYNSTFIGNNCTTDAGGGAIGATYGDCEPDIHIVDCIFKDNYNKHSSGNGGAISILAKGKLEVYNSTFIHNGASRGTAIQACANEYGSPTITIIGNKFINHTLSADVLRVNLSGTDYLVANNTYINNGIPFNELYLNVSEVFDKKINVTINYSIKNPEYYESDILNQCSYDIYIDGKYSKTIHTHNFTLNFEDIEKCKVYVVPSIYSGSTPEITLTVPRSYVYVSQKYGNDTNNGLTKETPVKTISQAIKLAKSCENVFLMDGTFNEENNEVDYRLTIWGTDQSSIGGSVLTNTMFNVNNAKFSLRNLTISGFEVSNDDAKLVKGNLSRIYLDKCIVKDNEITKFIESSVLGITDSLFENNKISIKTNELTISNSLFNNTANNDLGLFSSTNANDWNIKNSQFTNNNLKYGLISYASQSGILKIENSIFENNSGLNHASCIILSDKSRLNIISSMIKYNDEKTAAIYKNGSDSIIDIKNSIILNSGEVISGDTSNIDCNYNWWGNTFENINQRPNLNSEVSLDNWLFLNVEYPENVEIDKTYDINFDLTSFVTKDGTISNYPNYDLPGITFTVATNNITLKTDDLKLKKGKLQIRFALADLTNGSLTISYENIASTVNFTFTKTNPVRQISAPEILFGNEGSVKITFMEDLTGEVTIHIYNITETKKIENKFVEFKISGLSANTYHLTVSYNGDTRYSSFEDEINFTVKKHQSHTSILVGEIKPNKKITVTVKVDDDATGNITLIINGIGHELIIQNGKTIYDIENTDMEECILNATYTGDNKYLPSQDYKKIRISKNNVSIYLNIEDIEFGQDAFLEINLDKDATGNISASVDDIHQTKTLKDGKTDFTFSDLIAGDKQIQIIYSGDDNYNEKIITVGFYVEKATTSINLSAINAKEGQNIIVEMSIPKGRNGKFIISAEDIHEEVEIPLNGKVIWKTSTLKVGNHTIKVTYNGNNYFTCTNSIEVAVLPWDEPQWPNEGYDNSGKTPYESEVNGKIKWIAEANGIASGNIVIDNEGNIYLMTSNGIYSIDNDGKIRWNYSSKLNDFTGLAVARDIIISTGSSDAIYFINQSSGEKYGNSNILQVSSAFTPFVDKNANVYISGDLNSTGHYNLVIIPYSAWERGNGVIYIDLGTSKITTSPVLVTNNIVCLGTNDGLKIIDVSKRTVISNVNIQTTVHPLVGDGNIIYIIGNSEIIALNSTGGQLWKSASSMENARYSAIDNDYHMLYAVDYQNTLYKYDLMNYGKETLLSRQITSGILLGNSTIYVGANNSFVALDNNGKILWKSTTGDKIISSAVMDKNGIVYAISEKNIFTFTHSNLTNPNLSINTTDIEYGENAKLVLTIAKDATGEIRVSINNTDYIGTYTEEGTYVIPVPNLDDGDYLVNVSYSGDKRYSQIQISKTITVVKPKENITGMELNIPDSIYSDNPQFSYKFPTNATGELKVIIDDKSYSAEIVNGRVSLTIPKLSVGSHNITISYSGNRYYYPLTNYQTLVIYPITITDNKDLTMDYNTGARYSVRVFGNDGKALAGAEVIFNINKKSIPIKTDIYGYASLKIDEVPNKYIITVKYGGEVVNNNINVNQILKSKNIAVKKSAKKLVLTANLKLSNGKPLKNKLIKFKLNGKTYKAKTNKKGLAKVKIKKKVIKKLKVGKKYTLKITYLKDTIQKSVKIKK